MKKQIIWAIALIFVLALFLKTEEPKKEGLPIGVSADCTDKEECKLATPVGYCNVIYDCEVGKCYHEFIRCPELCYTLDDEDYDGLAGCSDPDCYDSKFCPCDRASFNVCNAGTCYCSSGSPRWVTGEENSWCQCI